MGSIYKYINKTTGIVEYVGIVYDRPLYKRLYEHNKYDGMDGNKYIVQYVKCNSRTEYIRGSKESNEYWDNKLKKRK